MFEQLFRSVAGAEVADLRDDALLEHINACEQLKSRVEALQATALAEFSRRRDAEAAGQRSDYRDVAHASAVMEVAAACHWSDAGAARRMAGAQRLTERPRIFDAFARADLDGAKARLVLDTLERLSTAARNDDGGDDAKDAAADAADRVEALAIEAGPTLTWSQLKAKLRTWSLTLAPGTVEAARVRTDANRCVDLHPMDDGQAGMWVAGPELDLHTLHARIDAEARHLRAAPDETRTLDQLRFDILTGLAHTPLPGTTDPTTGVVRPSPIRVEIGVLVPASTLLGVPGGEEKAAGRTDSASGRTAGADRPADVTGLGRTGDGTITAALARLIATGRSALGADVAFRRYLTNPVTGHLTHTDATTYRPTAATTRTVRAIRPHCTMPGCTIPAASCELDHATAHNRGGTTCWCNLQPLCKRHHLVKTHGVWTATITPHGHTIWTTPTGDTRIVRMPRLDPAPPLKPVPATWAGDPDQPPF